MDINDINLAEITVSPKVLISPVLNDEKKIADVTVVMDRVLILDGIFIKKDEFGNLTVHFPETIERDREGDIEVIEQVTTGKQNRAYLSRFILNDYYATQDLKVKVATKVYPVTGDRITKAYATAYLTTEYKTEIIIKDIVLKEKAKGKFYVEFPQQKGKEVVSFCQRGLKKTIEESIIYNYDNM